MSEKVESVLGTLNLSEVEIIMSKQLAHGTVLLCNLLAGCDDNPIFMSHEKLVDRGFSDGFAVGCDERGHLTYGYDDET